ncbi:MAG: DUF3794 and LysM peptidoglycan-binding domain-containing protein [Clostridium sp.]
MSQIDVIKERIQYEQLLNENSSNHILKGEYLIRDSHPDMKEVLGVDAKANITNKEILGDKVLVEGLLTYTMFYLPKEEAISEIASRKIHSVTFTEKFANYLDLENDEHRVICDVECEIEHIEANLINERKAGIDGVLELRWELYRSGEFEYVKDVEGKEDIQVLKKQEILNGVKGEKEVELLGKSMMKVTMDKPEIEDILNCTLNLHKKEIKIGEDKVYIGCYCKVEVLYKGKDTCDIMTLQDDVYLSKEEELVGINNDMMSSLNMIVNNSEYTINTDDLGENRIVNLEFVIKGNVKVFSKEKIDLITDAYSPSMNMELATGNHEIGIIQGSANSESMVKDNIYLKNDNAKIEQIISVNGSACVTDKIVENDRVKIEGLVKVSVLYKLADEENCYGIVCGELPFLASTEIKGAKEGMDILVKASLENIDANIEANTIAIRATVITSSKVCYKVNKEWVVDILDGGDEKKEKKSSITIYVIGLGDTIWQLAKKYNTTMEELIKLNDIENPQELKAGEKLIIPGRAIF